MSTRKQDYGDPGTRRRILDVALDRACKLGPTMRLADVSHAAGVSHQGLYLHFRGRDALLVALLGHMVETFGLHARYERVTQASDGVAALEAMVDHLAFLNRKLDAIGWVLEEAQHLDRAFGRDWRRRVVGLRAAIKRDVIMRLAREGRLGKGWSTADAANLFLSVTSLGTWRDLTHELRWKPKEYTENITRVLKTSLLVRG